MIISRILLLLELKKHLNNFISVFREITRNTMEKHMSKKEALQIIRALKEYEAEINCLMEMIGDKKFLAPHKKSECQSKFKNLKESLKLAAKIGTVDGVKRVLTDYESAYFQPAVNSAFVNCNVAVNSHPIKSNWFSCIYDMNIDISDMLSQLAVQYPDL
jgi:hypothetical protein